MQPPVSSTIRTHKLLGTIAIASCLACSSDPMYTDATESTPDALGQLTTPDPNGTYFAEVNANGTGCPAGTWNTRISRDGLVFTTTFSGYVAQVSPSTGVSVQDCQLSIRLHTPAGRSFSVQSFSYTGYALLQPGVVGRHLASYYFQGQPVQTEAARADLVGPYDDDFLFKDDVRLEDAVWSPCGLERDLTINTRILLQNTTPGKSGYMNLTATDGSALIISLASRNCSEFGTPPSRPPATAPAQPPLRPPPSQPTTTADASATVMGQPKILDIDDYENGNLLLAQSATLAKPGSLKTLSFYVTKAAGLLRMGVYDANGPGGRPGMKLAETAELTPVVGWNTARVTRPITLPAGKYWLAYLPSRSDLHFRRGGENSGTNTWYAYPYGQLPALFSSTSKLSTDHWSFYATLE